jgi:hypothetical protein
VQVQKKFPVLVSKMGSGRVKNTQRPDTTFIILDLHSHYFGAETNPILFLLNSWSL